MKPGGALGRISVLLVFGCLAAAAALAGRRPAPAGVAADDLRKAGEAMAAGARLHAAPSPLPPPGTAAFCRECHPAPPHPGPGIAPALLNAHAARLDCLLCHWSDAAGARPRPAWQAWPAPGRAGERLLQLALYPPPGAPRDELARVRGAVTARQKCFGRGPACGDCHRPGGITAWARPGAPAARAAALERLEDYFRLPPGEKWYFPQFP